MHDVVLLLGRPVWTGWDPLGVWVATTIQQTMKTVLLSQVPHTHIKLNWERWWWGWWLTYLLLAELTSLIALTGGAPGRNNAQKWVFLIMTCTKTCYGHLNFSGYLEKAHHWSEKSVYLEVDLFLVLYSYRQIIPTCKQTHALVQYLWVFKTWPAYCRRRSSFQNINFWCGRDKQTPLIQRLPLFL